MAQVIAVTIVWLFLEVPFLTILGGEKPPKNGGLFFRQIIHFAHTCIGSVGGWVFKSNVSKIQHVL